MNMDLLKKIITLFVVALPLIGVFAPRFFGFLPIIFSLIVCGEYFFHNKKLPNINKKLLSFVIIFLVFSGTSYFWAINPDFTLKRVLKLSILVIPSLFLLFTAHSTQIFKAETLRLLPYSVFSAAIILSIETYFDYPLYRLVRNIPFDVTVAPVVINWSLVILSFLVWPALYTLWSNKNKHLIAPLMISVSFAILTSTSQSAMVALVLGCISLLISIKQPKVLLYGIGGTTIFGIFASPWLAQALFQLRPEIFINWTGASAAQRMELWDFVARKALEKPWLGWGIEATRHIKDFDSAKIFYSTTNIIHPHNFALQLWIELGLIGAISGALFIFLCTKNLLQRPVKQLPFITACFTALIAVNLVGYGVWQGWFLGSQFITAFVFITLTKQDETTS